MLVTLFLAFAIAIVHARDTRPTLTKLLNGTANSNTSEFFSLLELHGDLLDLISAPPDLLSPNSDSVTILVPSNDAFAKLPFSTLGAAFKNNDTDMMRTVLEYHVLDGSHPANSFNGSFSFPPTWLKNSSYTNVTDGQVVGGVQQSPNVNIFTSGLGSRSTLLTPDQTFTNGLVHIIDTFLTPPLDLLPTAAQFNLTAFAGALARTNLLDLVSTTNDITIFCPSNSAFEALGSSLDTMPANDLANLLRYHIVPGQNGKVNYSPSLSNGAQLPTMLSNKGSANSNIAITSASNSLFANSARLTTSDILLANGVLHIIDNVLSSTATSAAPVPSLATQVPVISGSALEGNAVPFTTDFPASATASLVANSSMPTGALTSSFSVGDIGVATKVGRSVSASGSHSAASATSGGPGATGTGMGTGTSGAPALGVTNSVWVVVVGLGMVLGLL